MGTAPMRFRYIKRISREKVRKQAETRPAWAKNGKMEWYLRIKVRNGNIIISVVAVFGETDAAEARLGFLEPKSEKDSTVKNLLAPFFVPLLALLLSPAISSSKDSTMLYVRDVSELEAALSCACNGNCNLQIFVEAGLYNVGTPLRIWSGTTLTLDDDAVIRYTGTDGQPILRGSHFDEEGYPCYETSGNCWHTGYTQCHDVSIQGGTWDRNSLKTDNSNIFIFRHASNITVKNMKVKNCSNHFFNFSGSKNIVISNVEFSSAVKYSGRDPDFWGIFSVGDPDRYKTIEAVHLDALTKAGEPSAYPVDGTPCSNITVSDCIFKNVFAGVGTHHVSEGRRASGIKVSDCSFSGLQSFAVYCFGYVGAQIVNNEVVGGSGLVIVEDSTCDVLSNTSNGGNHNAIQVGNHSTAFISANTLKNAGMAAIRGLGASSLTANDNTIVSPKTQGISVAEGSVVNASGNAISQAGQHGFYVFASTASLSGNKVISPKEAGIRGDSKAMVTATSNVITGAGTYGITMSGSSKLVANSNMITSPKKYGIILDSCAASSISMNVITSPGSVGIRANKSKGCTVSGNTVTSTAPNCDGILLDNCGTGTISGNTVKKAGGFGIRVLGTKANPAKVGVSGNTVATASAALGYHDIRLGDYCKSCKVIGNTLVNKKFSISSTGTSGNIYKPVAPKIVNSVLKTRTTATIQWKPWKYGDGYQIQYADNKSFSHAKMVNVKNPKTAKTSLPNLSAKKRYYVRIRSRDSTSGAVCYSSWSAAFAILPTWAFGSFNGYAVVNGEPGTMTMAIANTGAVSGELVLHGVAYPFSAKDLTKWTGTSYKLKLSIPVGAKKWKPTYTLSQVSGAEVVGVAKVSVKKYSSLLARSLQACSSSGKLAKLVGKKATFGSTTANIGLADSNRLDVSYESGDVMTWKLQVGKTTMTGREGIAFVSAVKSGKSITYVAKVPVIAPGVGFARLLTCKIIRKKNGACSSTISFSGF